MNPPTPWIAKMSRPSSMLRRYLYLLVNWEAGGLVSEVSVEGRVE